MANIWNFEVGPFFSISSSWRFAVFRSQEYRKMFHINNLSFYNKLSFYRMKVFFSYSLNLNESKSTDYQWNLTDSNTLKEVTVYQSNSTDYFSENWLIWQWKIFFHWWKFDWFRFREYVYSFQNNFSPCTNLDFKLTFNLFFFLWEINRNGIRYNS